MGLLLCGTLLAQVPDALSNHGSRIVVKSQLVILDTVVTDRKGNIVTGLKRDDFQVYEDGVAQTVRNFDGPGNRSSIPDVAVQDRNGNDDWGYSPLTMIVIDEMDTPFSEISYAKQCVEKYLRAQPAKLAEPTILLWLNDNGIRPVTKFTRDRDTILQAILKHPPSSASKLARGAAVDQIAASFSALQQAALFSRGQPGKKEIMWVGRSFPAINGQNMAYPDMELMSKALHSTIDLLLASRVSVYVIDPTLDAFAPLDQPDAINDTTTIEPMAAPKITDPFANSFNINLFVQQTGGKYYRGTNDLDQAISDGVQRGSDFYTLTYVPAYRESTTEYHSITIRLNDPNLKAQVKQGYYTNGAPGSQTAKAATKQEDNDLRFDLYEATITGMPYTGLGLHVEQCRRNKNESRATCNISVDSGTLTFLATNKGEEQTVILAVVSSLNAKGRILNHTSQQLTLGVPESEASRIHNGNMPLALETLVPLGTKRVRVVLRDVSGRIGTAEVDPTQVPALISSTVVRRGLK